METARVTFNMSQPELLFSEQTKTCSRLCDIYSILAVKAGDRTRLLAGWQANKPDLATKCPPQIGMGEQEYIITVYNTSIIIIIIISNRYENNGRSSTTSGVIRLFVTEHALCFTQNWFQNSATLYSGARSFVTTLKLATSFPTVSIRADFFETKPAVAHRRLERCRENPISLNTIPTMDQYSL
jgi:hypothetical protein